MRVCVSLHTNAAAIVRKLSQSSQYTSHKLLLCSALLLGQQFCTTTTCAIPMPSGATQLHRAPHSCRQGSAAAVHLKRQRSHSACCTALCGGRRGSLLLHPPWWQRCCFLSATTTIGCGDGNGRARGQWRSYRSISHRATLCRMRSIACTTVCACPPMRTADQTCRPMSRRALARPSSIGRACAAALGSAPVRDLLFDPNGEACKRRRRGQGASAGEVVKNAQCAGPASKTYATNSFCQHSGHALASTRTH